MATNVGIVIDAMPKTIASVLSRTRQDYESATLFGVYSLLITELNNRENYISDMIFKKAKCLQRRL